MNAKRTRGKGTTKENMDETIERDDEEEQDRNEYTAMTKLVELLMVKNERDEERRLQQEERYQQEQQRIQRVMQLKCVLKP